MKGSGGTDAEVVERSLTDPAVFAVLFDRHAPAIHTYLGRRLGRDGADELLAEVFRIAFERRDTYRGERPAALPWLYGIAANIVLRHREREARWLRGRTFGDTLAATAGDAVSDCDNPVVAGALWPAVAAGLLSLPDGDRDALVLFAWEGLSYEDIAQALDIPIGTCGRGSTRATTVARTPGGTNGKNG
jgi:RNA polymerase sigma-70 factor (ECF subfamily)